MQVTFFIITLLFSIPFLFLFDFFYGSSYLLKKFVDNELYFLPLEVFRVVGAIVICTYFYTYYVSLKHVTTKIFRSDVGLQKQKRSTFEQILFGLTFSIAAVGITFLFDTYDIAYTSYFASDGFLPPLWPLFALPFFTVSYIGLHAILNNTIRMTVSAKEVLNSNTDHGKTFFNLSRIKIVLGVILFSLLIIAGWYGYSKYVLHNTINKMQSSGELVYGDIIRWESLFLNKIDQNTGYLGEKYSLEITLPPNVGESDTL